MLRATAEACFQLNRAMLQRQQQPPPSQFSCPSPSLCYRISAFTYNAALRKHASTVNACILQRIFLVDRMQSPIRTTRPASKCSFAVSWLRCYLILSLPAEWSSISGSRRHLRRLRYMLTSRIYRSRLLTYAYEWSFVTKQVSIVCTPLHIS